MSRIRMAFEQLPQTERTLVRDALRPWSHRLGKPTKNGNFNADLWEGATPELFIKRHDNLRDALVALSRSGNEQDMRNVLMQKHNHNLEDANDQIRRIMKSHNPDELDLQKLVMSVPQAEADEHLARAALQLSGYRNVDSLKGATTKATDIIAETPDGYELLVDAQVRGNTNGRLNLSLLKGINLPASEVERGFLQLPDNALLMDYIRKLRDKSRAGDKGRFQSAREGKLMQTDSKFNDSPSQYFLDNMDVLRKDAIITSLRPLARDSAGRLLPHKDHIRLRSNSPAFNPELPQQWDLMDLDQARSVLSGIRVGDLKRRNAGIQAFFNKDYRNPNVTPSINIGIDQQRLEEMLGNLTPLSSTVQQALVIPA